ncbi:GTP diphosphokinase, partial [Pseudidiomarina aestuarii]
MVLVRSTHVDKPQQHGNWLAAVPASARAEAIKAHSDWLTQHCKKRPGLLLKGQEMVEILGTLNLDHDSLVAALFEPALEAGVIQLEAVEEQTSGPIVHLIQAVQQMQTISE